MNNFNANNNKKPASMEYQSCIKIDGVPILPPLMTPSKRKEMAYYKQLAIAVELRLNLLKASKLSEVSPTAETSKGNSNFYNCGTNNYKLVYADPDKQTTEVNEKACKELSSPESVNNLGTTVSCPIQICPNLDKTENSPDVELRNFTSAPGLVRSNSYTLEHPSPMLKAELVQLGLYDSYKLSKAEKSKEPTKDNEGACGDNITQKIGVKRKLPMKYSELNNYSGYSEAPPKHCNENIQNDHEIVQNDNEIVKVQNDMKLKQSFVSGQEERKPRTIYRKDKNTDIVYKVSQNTEGKIEVTEKLEDPEKPRLLENTFVENIDTPESYNINIPADTQKSIQNLFETIQNNHSMQMQKLMEQQKADQQLLRKAFEKQQALLLNEIHRSYSLSHVRKDFENPVIDPDPEIPALPVINIFEPENKSSVESDVGFLQTSKSVLSESGELLKRASSSIDSYLGSHCPSTKVSQDCISSVTSSTAILCQKHDIEMSPNTTLDVTDVFYTPLDTPVKAGDYKNDYKKTMNRFEEFTIEDVNEEQSEKCHQIQNGRSNTECSEVVRDCMSMSNTSSVRGFHRELFPNDNEREMLDSEMQIQDHAATVLCAAARSFLVRRLLRTQKVCSIKRAIRETLLCALKLHGEGGIKTSDADLHRRLIQKLNTACHELHDIFFSTTVAERMRLISRDREIIVGPYQNARYGRGLSTMSTKSYSTDVSPRKDVRRCMSYSLTRKPWR